MHSYTCCGSPWRLPPHEPACSGACSSAGATTMSAGVSAVLPLLAAECGCACCPYGVQDAMAEESPVAPQEALLTTSLCCQVGGTIGTPCLAGTAWHRPGLLACAAPLTAAQGLGAACGPPNLRALVVHTICRHVGSIWRAKQVPDGQDLHASVLYVSTSVPLVGMHPSTHSFYRRWICPLCATGPPSCRRRSSNTASCWLAGPPCRRVQGPEGVPRLLQRAVGDYPRARQALLPELQPFRGRR